MRSGNTVLATRLHADPPAVERGVEEQLAETVHRQLLLLGEDPARPGLERTPERAAAALAALTTGYAQTPAEVIGEGVFPDAHEGVVVVRDVEFYSVCEHHLLPFFGKVHVAYVPDGRIIGLSKIPRLVEVFARRLQVQERLTDEVANALMAAVAPRGVGVVIEAQHLCMMMRGVEKQGSSTVTSAYRGVFRTCSDTREQFLRLVQRSS